MSSVIEVDGVPIANKTFTITRGGVIIEQWVFAGADLVPDATLDAKFIVQPDGAAEEEWNAANGRFSPVTTGTYLLDLEEAYTSAIAWDFALYHLYVIDSSGNTVPCITNGFVFVVDC